MSKQHASRYPLSDLKIYVENEVVYESMTVKSVDIETGLSQNIYVNITDSTIDFGFMQMVMNGMFRDVPMTITGKTDVRGMDFSEESGNEFTEDDVIVTFKDAEVVDGGITFDDKEDTNKVKYIFKVKFIDFKIDEGKKYRTE